jgi:hypothetical protein
MASRSIMTAARCARNTSLFDFISHTLHDPFLLKAFLAGLFFLAIAGTFAVLGSKEEYD